MFVKLESEIFRVVQEVSEGGYLVSCEEPNCIRFVVADTLQSALRVEVPPSCLACTRMMNKPTKAIRVRMNLLKPLLEEPLCILNQTLRKKLAQEIAGSNGTTARRVLRLYCRYLATGAPVVPKMQQLPKAQQEIQPQQIYIKTIKRFHFSAKKPTLKETYVSMLSAYYTDANGQLAPEYPSWHSFRTFYYRHKWNALPQGEIARNGLTNYQRNLRPLHGTQSAWQENIGVFQMDATIADLYLVDEYNRNQETFGSF